MVGRHILHLPIRPTPSGFSPLCSFILPTWNLKAFESVHWFLFRCHKSTSEKSKYFLWKEKQILNSPCYWLGFSSSGIWKVFGHVDHIWHCFQGEVPGISKVKAFILLLFCTWHGSSGSSCNLPQPLLKAFLFTYICLYMIYSFWKKLWDSL